MIASKSYISKVMENSDIFPLKKFSQNFLISSEKVSQIVDALEEINDEIILEIGPGLGALSEEIISRGAFLTSYEIDSRMCTHLNRVFGKNDKFKLCENDFMKVNLDEYKNIKVKAISNLPYALTTPIIERVITRLPRLETFVFMVQKEVGPRLKAKPKTKEYSPLSIFLACNGTLEKICDVSRSCFFPAPNVDSTVYRYKNTMLRKDNKEFFSFLCIAFAMRRKTLLNNLMSKYDKETILKNITSLNLKPTVRPEEITPDIFYSLFKLF